MNTTYVGTIRSVLNLVSYALTLGFWCLPITSAYAQSLSADLTTGTTVTLDSDNNQFVIDSGTISEESLFHSFETFSPERMSVVFDLTDVANDNINFVIGRVTGQQASSIDGVLKIIGGDRPDLLLINPAGITFGPNATLQLPSSFFASTAESVLFDNEAFSALNPTVLPLLSVSVPTGLQMGSQSGAITHRGTGHSLAVTSDPIFSPYQPTGLSSSLAVHSGNTLGLIGNTLNLYGGTLTASGGRIDLVSLGNGQVTITPQNQGFTLIPNVPDEEATRGATPFSDINLGQRALIDVGGPIAGDIHLQGQNIRLTDGSNIWSQNRGLAPAGKVTIEAAERLSLSGQLTQGAIVSSILTETVGPGTGSDISITTPHLTLAEGSSLGSAAFGPGTSGRVTVNTENLEIDGHVAIAPSIFSRLGTFTVGSGQANAVDVTTEKLTITQGGYLGSTTLFANGNGGDVTVMAQDIEVNGTTPTGELSLIVAASIAGSGNAGNLKIVTDRLSVTDSGSVLTSSFANGSSGNIDITATDRVLVRGQQPGFRESAISSGVVLAPLSYQQLLGNFQIPTGDAGQLSIKTQTLQVDEGGTVTVANLGTGRAGVLNAQAQEIVLSGGDINAITASGQGGDIALHAETLRSSQGSVIQATSLGAGDGGNILIDSPFIVGRGNSDIVANAVDGQGGNINIVTQGLFGFQFREQLTPQSDITASSELGIEGTVEIANTGVELNSGLVTLPAYFSDVDNQVASACSITAGNQFVASGRGGLAANPSDRIEPNRPWQDLRPSSNPVDSSNPVHSQPASSAALTQLRPVTEAASWQRNAEHQVELIAIGQEPNLPTAECLRRQAPTQS